MDEVTQLQLQTIDANKVDMEDRLRVIANLLGYKSMPPSIDEFITNPYYMGDLCKDLFPFWVDKLKQIFPDPIHTRYPILVIKGGIGTGKSTVVRVMAEYTKCRLSYLRDPWATFKLMKGKNLKFSFFSYSSTLAQTDFVDVLNNWDEESPHFKQCHENGVFDRLETVADGPRTNANIGSDVLFYNLSEINFIGYDKAHDKLDQALKRWDSRFGMFKNYLGMLIVDTSSRGDDSIADEFANSNPYGDLVMVINTNQWIVREHFGYYGRKGWFQVYCGDSLREPYIIGPNSPLHQDSDPDRVIKVPEELRPDFEFDLISALQDKAGISTSSSDRFIKNPESIKDNYRLPQYGPDVAIIDFFDKTDKLIYKYDKLLLEIPDDKVIYVRFDIGVVSDNAGLALAFFKDWVIYDKDKKVRSPRIAVPLAVGLSRHQEQETPIAALFEFVMDLNERFEIGRVTADQFASRQLLQDLTREGIPNALLSVDRTDEAYVFLKNLMISKLLYLPNNKLLIQEIANLRRVGRKIDHPTNGSKDIADAVAGVVFDLYKDIKKAGQISNKYRARSYTASVIDRYINDVNPFEDMVQKLF